jgi:hypothetical protein
MDILLLFISPKDRGERGRFEKLMSFRAEGFSKWKEISFMEKTIELKLMVVGFLIDFSHFQIIIYQTLKHLTNLKSPPNGNSN